MYSIPGGTPHTLSIKVMYSTPGGIPHTLSSVVEITIKVMYSTPGGTPHTILCGCTLKIWDDKVRSPIQFHTNSVQGISMQMIFTEVGRVTNVQNTAIIAGHVLWTCHMCCKRKMAEQMEGRWYILFK